MRTHNFAASMGMGVIGETLLYSLLNTTGHKVEDVRKEREWQKKGIDFIWNDILIDAKFDTQAPKTNNIALETISSRQGDVITKKGWVYTSHADVIVYIYLIEDKWRLVLFSPEEARDMIEPRHRRVPVKNTGYMSEVVLVPQQEFPRQFDIPIAGTPGPLVEALTGMVN